MQRRPIVLLLPAAVLAACNPAGSKRPPPATGSVAMEEIDDWRGTAAPASVAEIEALPARWAAARMAAAAKNARAVGAYASLLEQDTALPHPNPAPGPYRCRTVRLAPAAARARVAVASRWAFCFVGADEQDALSLTAEVPGARLGGYLYGGRDRRRLIFLGGGVPRGSTRPAAYGADGGADVAALFQRIDEFRYRLVLAPDGDLLVYELIASPRQVPQ
ncbi:MAG TPA: DUF4893 domain-containing protein [Allosphingosinicella sp.]|nr:DUF4893 domain-containing protein [Allosphingosinicella sp.]